MKNGRIVISTLFFVLTLGTMAAPLAQQTSTDVQKDHSLLLGLVRTINTAEAVNFSKYGSYASWQTLLARQPEFLGGWLAKFGSQEANNHFGEMPEVLPGWNLRLNVQDDGKGYVAILEDANDKTGYAAVIDERAVIRECTYLH